MENLVPWRDEKKKRRLIVRKGLENIALFLNEIAFFYTADKIVYAVDKSGKKYFTEQNLTELEQELDRQVFFRANRQYIISVNFIRGFKQYEKVKLMVDLNIPEQNHVIIISQETAPEFKRWIYAA